MRLRLRPSDVERWRSPFACATRRDGKSQPKRGVRLLVVVVQREILRKREVEDETSSLTILRDVSDDRGRGSPSRPAPVTSAPATWTDPAVGRRSPDKTSTSSDCPFPSTPAMPTISPACTVNDSPRTFSTPRSSLARTSSTWSIAAPGLGVDFSTLKQHLAPDHEAGEAGLGRSFSGRRSRSSCPRRAR